MSIGQPPALRPTLAVIAVAITAVGWATGAKDAAAAPAQSAPTLNGDWAPFNRCPVHESTMLSADGEVNVAFCLAINSMSGSVSIGAVKLALGESNTQAGLVINNEASPGTTAVTPKGGAIETAPLQLPGGLQALTCPTEETTLQRLVCRKRPGYKAGVVIVRLESAGELSNFNLASALGTEESLVSIPVKLHLENTLLGSHCYVGSNKQPIVLSPTNVGETTSFSFERFDKEGTTDQEDGVMAGFVIGGSAKLDASFSVPGASGCGLVGKLSDAIDAHLGLPSPAGANKLELNDTTTYLTGLDEPGKIIPDDGKILAQNWRSAKIESGH